MGRGPLVSGQPRSLGLNQSPERSGRPGYLSKHYDVEADAIGLDERAALSTSQVTEVLGKPREGGQVSGRRHRAGTDRCQIHSPGPEDYSRTS